jgi:hypothetical protein
MTQRRKSRMKAGAVKKALTAARRIVERTTLEVLSSNTLLESKFRPGAYRDGDYWHHPDTLDDPWATREYHAGVKALKLIDAAMASADD